VKRKKSKPSDNGNAELLALMGTLRKVGQRFEKLTAGQVDTVADSDGRTLLLSGTQEQLKQSENAKQVAILNALPAHIALLDAKGIIVSVNDVWRRFDTANVLQGNPGYDVGRNYLEICDAACGDGSSIAGLVAEGIRSVLSGVKASFATEYQCDTPTENRWYLLMVTPLAENRPTGAVLMHINITEQKRVASQLAHSAEHDFLTGLPNRVLLNDRVSQAVAVSTRYKKEFAVLFLDVDGFKHINDSLGHPMGDKLIQSIAKRLVDCVRISDTVSRQGGDEFIVLLSEVDGPQDTAIAARRILQAVAEPHTIDQHELHVTTSIGVSVYPNDGSDAETLIKNADTAMYQAKDNGRQSYQFFTAAMNLRAVERQSIEESLRRALERQEFTLHYQPKINLNTGMITGAEALLRWTHPIRGAVSPGEFIPVAEACGLIVPISRWVLEEACKQNRAWAEARLPPLTMAVNISGMEFRNESFLTGVLAVLEKTGLDPTLLELELTESVLMTRAESTESILKALRALGVRLAVDDFGTGYSSLSYLGKFPIDALKIDQSFVRQITIAPDETTIVAAIISLGRSLKLTVIAEGVETREQLAFLRAQHCDEAQGYYFSGPVLPQQFAKLLETGIPVKILKPW
jgi:diguanylate cyclase (GGDEF)-like protein